MLAQEEGRVGGDKKGVQIRGEFAGAGVFVRSDKFEYVLVSLGS